MDIPVYNYQCLLNIPSQIELLGPIRNRWEGGIVGEGFLRRVKPLLRPGRKNWQKNTLHRILRDKSCKLLLPVNTMNESSEETSKSISTDSSGNFRIYLTHSFLCDDLQEGKVISCFGFGDKHGNNGIASCYLHSGSKKVVRFKVRNEHNTALFGANYFQIETEDCDHSEELDGLSEIHFFGLFLPKTNPDGITFYTLITSEWSSLDKNGLALLPHKYSSFSDIISDTGSST